jgi:hypothetical protein
LNSEFLKASSSHISNSNLHWPNILSQPMERGEVKNHAKICEEALFLANG